MKHLKLFENFEVVKPILHGGDPLNDVEVNILKRFNVLCPEYILKEDNYYYIYDHRCGNIRDLPLTYIHGLCSKFGIKKYTINDDYSIDVDGNVELHGKGLTKIPLKFNKVSGWFYCYNNKLTTLEGCPEKVGGLFGCSFNNLTTLEGSPKEVGGDFYCHNNKLTTLEGSPKEVGGSFCCNTNKLTTLEGGPKYVGGNFYCRNNPLKSTEYKGIIKGELIYR